jgi:hypothetical protein
LAAVASPSGAGKTRLVVHTAEQLHRRAQLKIAIAAQTRTQALDMANRTAAIGGRVGLLGSRESPRPEVLERRATYLQGVAQLRTWRGIVVATTARWLWVNEREYTADVIIVDFSSRVDGVLDVGFWLGVVLCRTADGRTYATGRGASTARS